ncbi:hypothetical protein HY484_03430, partial [Candidatus Woesearchaeota archaeon]|nr:hypothetical protein [Candidatus Woesearchaeota archaeon]
MAEEKPEQKQKTWQQNSLEALLIGGNTYLLYQLPPAVIDTYYSNGIYKPIAGIEGIIGDAMPFSIIEALFATGMICLIYRTGKGIISGARKTREIFRKIKEQTIGQIASETLNYFRQLPTTFAESTTSLTKKGAVCVLALTALGGLNISRTHIIDKTKLSTQITIDLEELTTRTRKIIPQIYGTKLEKKEFVATLEKALDDAYYQ